LADPAHSSGQHGSAQHGSGLHGSAQSADREPLRDFTALVMADPALAARLATIADGRAFIAEAMRSAQMRGIALSETALQAAAQTDLIGLARYGDPPPSAAALPPREWLPIGVALDHTGAQTGAYVDWARFGREPMRAPFYEDEIRRALSLPFNRAFRYRTGFAALTAPTALAESALPSGFIFHMSRCGSTLAAQMLAALDDSIVISEAAPIDSAVQLARNLPDAAAVTALRAIVAAFGRRRAGAIECIASRYVLKLDCWHTLALPLFRRAFPDVPWLFLYRDPVEVLVSQMRQRGMQMVPQFLPPGFYGIADADSPSQEDYCARVLAAICQAVLDHHALGGGLVLNYRQLPDAVFTAVLPHFGIACSDEERDAMHRAARQDAKAPGLPFAGDAETKRGAASDVVRDAAARHLGAIYDRLEALNAEALNAEAWPPGKALS
jgi:hypothetical protein